MIRRVTLLALFAGAALWGPVALGQDAPPPPPPDQAAPPPDAASPPSPPAAGDDQPSPVIAPPPPSVQAQSLDTLDLFSAGRETGLGPDLWKGSSATIARAVIPTLADKPLSPAGMALARKLLSTGANAPAGAGSDTALATARVRALLALGDAVAVDSIVERTPNLSADTALSQVAAEAALITDEPDKACRIGDALQAGRQAVYWIRLRAYCQARAGRTAEAQLTLSLAAQEHAEAAYMRMMGVVLAGGGDPGAPSLRDGIDYALTHQLQLDPRPALPGAPPAIAEHVRASLPTPGPTGPMPPPGTAAPAVAGPAAAAPGAILAPSEAEVLAPLHAAKTPADYLAAAKAEAPALAGLVTNRMPLAQPVQVAMAAIAAGDLSSAQTIRASLTGDTIPGASGVDLAILDAALAVAAGRPDPQTLDKLAERGAAEGPARQKAQAAAVIFAPLAGLADPESRAEIAGFDLAAPGGTAAEALALDMAADAKARGDVGLLALSLAEAGGAAGPAPLTRARIEAALARAGLAGAARSFALEGLAGLEVP
jgi:hypothetical protein